MTTHKKTRATALVPWAHEGKQGVLVHADSDKNEWILPGGGLEQDANGRVEVPRVAVARELAEETGLTAEAVATLFLHDGKFRVHHVFHIRPSGTLQIVDRNEAPAFGLCEPDFAVTTIVCAPDYSTDGLTLSHSTKAIIGRYRADYQQMHGARPTPTPGNVRAAFPVTSEDGTTTSVQIGGAVGPVYHQYTPDHAARLLASAYQSSLALTRREGLRRITFPSLSTGIFGFPIEQATAIALETVMRYLTEHSGLDLVRFVLLNNTRPTIEHELRRLARA